MNEPLLRHIRDAEDWLRRAQDEWRRGNAAGAVRRLMLAEAEIRCAREAGARGVLEQPAGADAARPRGATTRRLAAGLAAAAVLAAGIGYAWLQAGPPNPDALAVHERAAPPLPGGVGRTIVQLDAGQLLMSDRGQDAAGTAAEPGFPGPNGSGFAAVPPGVGAGRNSPGFVGPNGRSLLRAVPVDLRTPSPTF